MRSIPSIASRLIPATMLLALAAAPAFARPLDVEVWTDKGDDAVYQTGDAMRIKVRPSGDSYVLVYEIDSKGQVNLLFPFHRGPTLVPGGNTLRLPPEESGQQLIVGAETGQGFIVAIASERPFRDLPWFLRPYDPQAASIGYEIPLQDSAMVEEGFDEHGNVVGDPYVAMERIRRRVVDMPENVDGIGSNFTTYYVHEVVRYPRYLCNDCHRPGYWSWWSGFDPYYTHCNVFDFRVNWRWYWGPTLWTGYVPYYYYVVRTDCPPHYTPWYGPNYRFTSWDGWGRWTDLWGGQLRRYKSTTAPASYTPPPPRGMIWKKGETPPGFVGADVRTRTASPGGGMREVFNRQRDKGAPAWREKPGADAGGRARPSVGANGRARPGDGAANTGRETMRGRSGRTPQEGGASGGSNSGERKPRWWRPSGDEPSRGGGDRAKDQPSSQPRERPRDDPPSGGGGQDPPPPRNDGGYRPPPPSSPPRQDNPPPPRWSPPSNKPSPPSRGGGGKGGSG